MSFPVQARRDNDDSPFILGGNPTESISAVLAQDAGRTSGDLLSKTLLAKVAGDQFVPFTDETATNGSALPAAIYLGSDILEQDIIDADVEGLHVLLDGAKFDEDKLVIENAKTLETLISQGTKDRRTVRDHLLNLKLIPFLTDNVSNFEN